jgi:hypothetical protein
MAGVAPIASRSAEAVRSWRMGHPFDAVDNLFNPGVSMSFHASRMVAP